MNYNRRSTRPDGQYYRESRKIRGAARTRGGGPGPVVILLVVAALAAVVYFLFFRP